MFTLTQTHRQTSWRHWISDHTNADYHNTELLLMGDFLHLVWGYSWIYKTPTTETTVMTSHSSKCWRMHSELECSFFHSLLFNSESLSPLHSLAKFTIKAEEVKPRVFFHEKLWAIVVGEKTAIVNIQQKQKQKTGAVFFLFFDIKYIITEFSFLAICHVKNIRVSSPEL